MAIANYNITGAVGGDNVCCPNRPSDVTAVKTLLAIAAINQSQKNWNPGAINGNFDSATLNAIKAFQTAKVGKATGIVAPSQPTLLRLGEIARGAVKSIISAQSSVLVAQSKRTPGKNTDGTIADDMKYGDYSKERLKNIRWNFAVDDLTADLNKVSAEALFDKFREMASLLFSYGEKKENILRMIEKFRQSSGGTYSDTTLDRAAKNHRRTRTFIQELERRLSTAITNYRGDIRKIQPNFDIEMRSRIVFNTSGDILDGLTIATNDIWAWTVEIVEYFFDGIEYRGKYKLTLYDHFGLDEPDVDYSKTYGNLAGFRAWFILQHLDRFAYKPFITVIKIDKTFSGSLA